MRSKALSSRTRISFTSTKVNDNKGKSKVRTAIISRTCQSENRRRREEEEEEEEEEDLAKVAIYAEYRDCMLHCVAWY